MRLGVALIGFTIRQREHRRKRNRHHYSYHVWMEGALIAQGDHAPVIEVTRVMCQAAQAGATITVEVMPGRWGAAWYRKIQIGDAVWRNPALD